MGRFVANSFLIAIPAVAGTVMLSAMAGFALAKHPFPGNRLLLMVFVAGNLVPFQAFDDVLVERGKLAELVFQNFLHIILPKLA